MRCMIFVCGTITEFFLWTEKRVFMAKAVFKGSIKIVSGKPEGETIY